MISGPYYVLLYYVSTHIVYGADSRFVFGLVPMAGVMLATWVLAWQRWSLVGDPHGPECSGTRSCSATSSP